MSDSKKASSKEKERKLLEKLKKTKEEIRRLQEKRKREIGMLAYKYGLDEYSDSILDKAFSKLAKELQNGDH